MFSKTFSLAILSSLALVGASEIQLITDSSESSVNGLGLSSKHEGAGINYFFLGSGSETLEFDEATGQVSIDIGNSVKQSISVDAGNFLQLSVTEFQKVTVADGVVSVDGNDKFYACKNVSDPYRYSADSYAVLSKSADGCFPITIKVKDGETSSATSSAAASSTITSAAPTSEASSTVPAVSTVSDNGAVYKKAGSVVGAIALVAAIL